MSNISQNQPKVNKFQRKYHFIYIKKAASYAALSIVNN